MPSVLNTLLTCVYLLISVSAGMALYVFVPWPIFNAAAVGIGLFLLMLQTHSSVSGSWEKKRVTRELRALRHANATLQKDFQAAKTALSELSVSLDKNVRTRNREIVAEVQVLEGLIKQLHEKAPPSLKTAMGIGGEGDLAAPPPQTYENDDVLLNVVHDALEDNRVDLYLQPIVSLPQRRIRYYEAFSRLRDADGGLIMPNQYLQVAEPAGLMSIVDNLLLFRCVQVMRRLNHRANDVAIFCNISSHTLRDPEFFPQFIEYMELNADLSKFIVFEFAQEAIQQCHSWEWDNLYRLSELGFAFSMDRVTSLDFDLHDLRQKNFRFLKVESSILLGGMEQAGARIQAADFKELAMRNGVDLIAEKIEDEQSVIGVLEYDVDFGQGFVFGHPRPISETGLDAVGTRLPRVRPDLDAGLPQAESA